MSSCRKNFGLISLKNEGHIVCKGQKFEVICYHPKRDITGETLGSSLYSVWLKTFKTICCGRRCIFPKSFPIDSAHQETMARFTLPSTSFYFADWIVSKSHIILETISTWPSKGIICVGEEGMSHRFLVRSDIELSLSIRPCNLDCWLQHLGDELTTLGWDDWLLLALPHRFS